MNTDQHILFPANGSTKEKEPGIDIRDCAQCGKKYQFNPRKGSRFCCDKCRRDFNEALNSKEEKQEKKSPAIPSPSINTSKLSPDAAIAIELLKAENARLNNQLTDERKENKKLTAQLARQNQDAKDREYQARLNGLEERKPDFMDRIASLPPQVLEAFTPILGRLGNLLIPDVGATPMAGVQGQLDEATVDFLAWVDQLPDDEKKDLFDMLIALRSQDPPVRKTSLMKVKNLFTNGTTIQATPYNASMYGN